jgi:hypothetical protein
MDDPRDIKEHIYYLIGGRILWEPNFIYKLKSEPEKTIKDTLAEAGVSVGDDIVKLLMDEYYANEDNILTLTKGWFTWNGEITPMVA